MIEGSTTDPGGVPRVLSSVVASQVGLHQRYGGVVPEIASRAHVRQVLPMIDEALSRANVAREDLDAVAVAARPGVSRHFGGWIDGSPASTAASPLKSH